jgi:hypothetical protein
MKKMLNSLKPFHCVLFILAVVFTGCEKANIQFGQEYIDNGYSNIVLVDSISPAISTIFKDSVPSSQTGVVMVGFTADPSFGKTTAASFVQLAPGTSTLPDLASNATYDSISLLTKCNGSYYGDTLSFVNMKAEQVGADILIPEAQFGFYNTSSFPTAGLLGTRSVQIRPAFQDSGNIRLPDALGKQFLEMLRRKSDTLKNEAAFLKFFKGVKISGTGNVIYGFRDSVVMRLYYHELGINYVNKFFDFKLVNRNLQFNNILTDRSGTPVDPAYLNHNNPEVFSSQSGMKNAGYSQPLTGIYLKVSFPTLRQILQRPDFIKIVKAELIVKPVALNYGGNYPLPPNMNAAQTDGLNEPGSPLIIQVGATAVPQTGNLNIDNLNPNNTGYSYDVTTYLQSQINVSGNNQNGLILIPPAASRYATLNRLVIGDSRHPVAESRIQLKLYYISVNPK